MIYVALATAGISKLASELSRGRTPSIRAVRNVGSSHLEFSCLAVPLYVGPAATLCGPGLPEGRHGLARNAPGEGGQ